MPIIESRFRKPLVYNRHFATIWMGRFAAAPKITYRRERIIFEVDDFLDLDWIPRDSKKLVVITHGLEGSSQSLAVRRIAALLSSSGYAILAWNLRGCSGEVNNKLASYNSGSANQLSAVIDHLNSHYDYENISLIGISAGGNITLKYLADYLPNNPNHQSKIRTAVAICPPCDLAGSSKQFDLKQNYIYLQDFLSSLKHKVKLKRKLLEKDFDLQKILAARTFADFDDAFTAKVFGYSSHQVYYQQASSLPVLNKIQTKCLIVSPKDDPFLSQSCYPIDLASNHSKIYLECPDYGGHVAFPWGDWLSQRCLEWLR